jgi:deoxyribonuclease-4
MVLLEHTAGQGRTVGHRFEHLAAILAHLDGSPRVGVCLDTCHLVAAGYDIVSDEGYARTFASLDRLVGLDRVKAFHGNDSKKPCGSRVDRHEHIGKGCLGLPPFRRLLHDPRFAGLPLLIETAKASRSERPGAIVADPYDRKNLATLRRLRDGDAPVARRRPAARARRSATD